MALTFCPRDSGYQVSALLGIVSVAALILGCSGRGPVREPPDLGITPSKGTRARLATGPVRLRYRCDRADVLIYRVATGEVDSRDGRVTGRRTIYRLSTTPVRGGDAVRVECQRSKAEGILQGDVFPITEEQESGITAEVDACGRVLRLLGVKGDEIPSGTLLATSGRVTFGTMVVGFLPAELALGAMHACPFPEGPLKAGDSWHTIVGIPSTNGGLAGPAVTYDGKLVRLEETDAGLYAIIEMKVLAPWVAASYVSEIRFDVRRGRVVFAKWRTIPGAPEHHPIRWVELMS